MNQKIPGHLDRGKLSLNMRILGITQKQVCYCVFENCTIDQYEQIHQYVFELQKRDLKK